MEINFDENEVDLELITKGINCNWFQKVNVPLLLKKHTYLFYCLNFMATHRLGTVKIDWYFAYVGPKTKVGGGNQRPAKMKQHSVQ